LNREAGEDGIKCRSVWDEKRSGSNDLKLILRWETEGIKGNRSGKGGGGDSNKGLVN